MTHTHPIPVMKIYQKSCSTVDLPTDTIKSPEDGVTAVSPLIAHTDREHFVVICLNTKNTILHMEVANIGSLNSCVVHPREIYKGAILCNAAAIIVAHIGMKNQWRNYNLLYPQCYINFAFFLMAKLSLKVGWR